MAVMKKLFLALFFVGLVAPAAPAATCATPQPCAAGACCCGTGGTCCSMAPKPRANNVAITPDIAAAPVLIFVNAFSVSAPSAAVLWRLDTPRPSTVACHLGGSAGSRSPPSAA